MSNWKEMANTSKKALIRENDRLKRDIKSLREYIESNEFSDDELLPVDVVNSKRLKRVDSFNPLDE